MDISRPSRISRRHLLGLAGAGAAGVVLASCGGGPMMGGNGPGGMGRSNQGAMPNGAPGGSWAEPPTLASTNGVLETTLTIATGMVPYGDGSRWALTVNGTSPGPTLRARPGDRLRLTLDNHMDHATSLHTHGLHVSPSGNSDNPFLMIEPGQRFTYEIAIPAEHPGGLFWYHSHLHHHSAEQVFAGFIGAIVVEDEFDHRADVAGARERLLVIHDARTGGTEAAVLGTSMMDQMTGREGNVVLVNGKLRPNLETAAGGLERWRIVNASASRFYRLSLAGHQLKVIGGDGGRLAAAIAADSLSLVPGERAELFVQPTVAGTYTLATSAVDRGTGMMGMGGGMMGGGTSGASDILRMVVTGSQPGGAQLPSLAGRIEDLRLARPERSRDVTLSMQGMNTFLIDGRSFDPDRVDLRARLGSVEEWTVRNTSTMDHPFHLHVWPFQVVDQSRGTPPAGWKDVVNVPAGGWAKVRIRFGDFTGKSVFHCHILDHEDMGMMGTIEVA